MSFSERRNTTRWIIVFISFLIISLILWNTYTFFQIFKNEERLKMNLWANAQKTLVNADENTDLDLPLNILNNNTSVPVMLTMYDKVISSVNVPDEVLADEKKSMSYLKNLKKRE